MMAETDYENAEFPLNFVREFRSVAPAWMLNQLGRDLQVPEALELRHKMRVALVTQTVLQAEVYAKDLAERLPERNWHVDVMVSASVLPAKWSYDAWVKCSTGGGNEVSAYITSDHLCRILSRVAAIGPHVVVSNWPEEWPRARFMFRAA